MTAELTRELLEQYLRAIGARYPDVTRAMLDAGHKPGNLARDMGGDHAFRLGVIAAAIDLLADRAKIAPESPYGMLARDMIGLASERWFAHVGISREAWEAAK